MWAHFVVNGLSICFASFSIQYINNSLRCIGKGRLFGNSGGRQYQWAAYQPRCYAIDWISPIEVATAPPFIVVLSRKSFRLCVDTIHSSNGYHSIHIDSHQNLCFWPLYRTLTQNGFLSALKCEGELLFSFAQNTDTDMNTLTQRQKLTYIRLLCNAKCLWR